ncbi:MAG: YgfZ/GcvT domain-containing protein [Pseudomonadota bacterium]
MIALNQSFIEQPSECVSAKLDDYGIIQVSGDDANSFLQGQLTCDMQQLKQQSFVYGAHCDPTGKAFSVFWLVPWQASFLLIMHRSAVAGSLAQFKKFGVFNQVTLEDVSDNWTVAGVFGTQADQVITDQNDDTIIIKVGSEPLQYLLLSPTTISTDYSQLYWDALEIERVRPQLTADNSQQFVPQMLNVQALGGVSFDKGCYIGQETIARMKYLGKQKRALFRLSGQAQAVKPGTELERQVGENWRRAGTVIMAVNRSEQLQDLLAVLPSDIEQDTSIRVRGDDASLLEIHSLPYQLG